MNCGKSFSLSGKEEKYEWGIKGERQKYKLKPLLLFLHGLNIFFTIIRFFCVCGSKVFFFFLYFIIEFVLCVFISCKEDRVRNISKDL